MMVGAKIIVKGSVQGVGFRYFCLQHADLLGLSGWVRNNRDGSVELLVEGEQESVDHFLVLLNEGPMAANVTSVAVNYCEATGTHLTFAIRR